MNKLEIVRTNGNVPKTIPGEDHVSGLVFYVAASTGLPTSVAGTAGFGTDERIKACSSLEMAERLGITANHATYGKLYQLLADAFSKNQGMTLYVGIFEVNATFEEVKTIQRFAVGRIRQVAVWNGNTEFAAAQVTALQTAANALESGETPLSILYYPKVSSLATLTGAGLTPAVTGNKNVSVIIAKDGLGIVLGTLSKAMVHESIAWVKKFPTGVDDPQFSDGSYLKNVDRGNIETLDSKRYIFFVTYPGLAGSYINDSHTMDVAISDYSQIENVRTMDKAVRGIRTYLLPELGGNIYTDATTGKLQPYSVEHLKLTANKALEDMEKAGELSGYTVEIDPEQNVLSTSTVEIVIKPIGVGVMRRISVKIGFATKE